MKTRKKRSRIWLMPKEELTKLVAANNSLASILRIFGMSQTGSYATLKRRLDEDGIDYSHIKLGVGACKGRSFVGNPMPLDQILILGSTYSRYDLKKRLLKGNILKESCAICGMGPTWQGKPLVLILDHINGIRDDNRLPNLRLLCPNCGSQVPTFAGRNHCKYKTCVRCGKKVYAKHKYCSECRGIILKEPKPGLRKSVRPPLRV
jgi:hypothetical protein